MASRKESLEVEKAAESFNFIKGRTERIFIVFLHRVAFPDAISISYEAKTFTSHDGKETTKPDCEVVRRDGKTIYIEITKERRNGTDPKERERRIMREAAPNCPYVVLYNNTLKKIQEKHKGYDFFREDKRIKKRKEMDLLPYKNPRPKTIKMESPHNAPSPVFVTSGRLSCRQR